MTPAFECTIGTVIPGYRIVLSSLTATALCACVWCQWSLATLETQRSHECQNIASGIIINFEKCNITLLQTKILRQRHVDQQTIRTRLNEIKTHSRSK